MDVIIIIIIIINLLQVGVPMRSIQVEGAYSDTGRAQAMESAILWDADRDQNMKLGVKGQLDNRGESHKVLVGLDLPFLDKVSLNSNFILK
jgi:hypothetical protein